MSPVKSPKHKTELSGYVVRGMIFGILFFLPGVLISTYWQEFARIYNGIRNLPVLTSISRDFESGFEIAGELFRVKSANFYKVDTTVLIRNSDGEITKKVSTASRETRARNTLISSGKSDNLNRWNRAAIHRKLSKEFGKKRMNKVTQYLDYIERYRDLAGKEMLFSQIPASITLAQGLFESNAGRSYLARVAKNHFGIKCVPRRGFKKDGVIDNSDFSHTRLAYDCLQRTDDHEWDRFEMYKSADLSYRRHTLLLTQNKRYNWMFKEYFVGQNYRVPKRWFAQEVVPYYAAWTIGLKKSGYATDRRYAQKLGLIIETYELWRIDYEVIFDPPTKKQSDYVLD